MAIVNPISKIAGAKAAAEASSAAQDKAFEKALSALSANLASGNLTGAKEDFVRVQQAQKTIESRASEPRAAVSQVGKQIKDLGAAFRSNDIKAAEKAATTLEKGLQLQRDSKKVVNEAIALQKGQKARATAAVSGVAASNSDSMRSLFNAIA